MPLPRIFWRASGHELPRHFAAMVVAAGLLCACAAPEVDAPAQSSLDFAAFVDDFLEHFASHHPSIAAGNGLHQHDDRLEDFSAQAIADEVASWQAFRVRLSSIPVSPLTPDERVDHRIVSGLIDAWLLELDVNRNWQKNLMLYASAISDGVHNLMTMETAPAEVRARRIIAKVAGVPALLASARANITSPPRVMAERGVRMLQGASGMLTDDLPLAFAGLTDAAVKAELSVAAARAAGEIDAFVAWFEKEKLASAEGSYAVGRDNLEARYRAEELIDVPAAQLLAIGDRELAANEAAFVAAAARLNPSRPALEVWADVLRNHPARGELVPAAQQAVDELQAFVIAKNLVALPVSERVVVAAAPPFDLGLASMHSSPPLEPTPVKSYFYVTDARPEWDAARQDAWLQKFNIPTLAVISAHEVMPGHYVHSVFMRKTPGKIRRIWIGLNPFPQPSSGQDGWAHYAEQMMLDEGFRADDPRYRMAQLSEAMTRICRLISGIQLHTGVWTVDQAAALFEQKAHLPPPAARQEAERGTYDPTYGGYFLGKLQALKLRDDVRAARGAAFDLREFHEQVMTNGIAPWWAHRQLLLPGDRGTLLP
ncbi:MAG: DUF885 domain-containing protein [Acidobacteriota bacterium]|nr:DUF885 domain-containing protein [Acidobacteriota bacterium]